MDNNTKKQAVHNVRPVFSGIFLNFFQVARRLLFEQFFAIKTNFQAILRFFRYSPEKDGLLQAQDELQKLKELTRKTSPVSFDQRIQKLKQACHGWINYFKYASIHGKLKTLDGWLRIKRSESRTPLKTYNGE